MLLSAGCGSWPAIGVGMLMLLVRTGCKTVPKQERIHAVFTVAAPCRLRLMCTIGEYRNLGV